MAKSDGTYKFAAAQRVQHRGAARTAAESALTEVMAGVSRLRHFGGRSLRVQFVAEEDGLYVLVYEREAKMTYEGEEQPRRDQPTPVGKWRVVVL